MFSRTCCVARYLLQLVREIVSSPALDILLLLKQSSGMSVNELSRELKMSYMGVKQHCVALEKRRYLDTQRRPKTTGRPEKIYRLTSKTEAFFPQWSTAPSLELLAAAGQVFGETASAKLLFQVFQERAERWRNYMDQTDLAGKVTALTRLRLQEGHLCALIKHPQFWMIVDHHDPLQNLALHYPVVRELDRASMERVLGVPVTQHQEAIGHRMQITHQIARIT